MSAASAPRVIFRADASPEIGSGHVMRCQALAEALRARGAVCEFNGDWPHFKNGANPHFLVVDHYGLDRRWEEAQRAAVDRIMVIDDLADRPHDCDLLLDQNLGSTPADYEGLVPADCELLCGPEFALLRPEFARLRQRSLEGRAGRPLSNILVSMGGADKDNATGRVLDALGDWASGSNLPGDLAVTVVMGSMAPWIEQVRAQAEKLQSSAGLIIEVAVDVADMAERMAASDFAIGAAGGTSWERCCMGLPSALAVLADNQAKPCRELVAAGAAFALGAPGDIIETLPPLLDTLMHEPARLAEMSAAAAAICDGRGAERVAARLLAEHGRPDAHHGRRSLDQGA